MLVTFLLVRLHAFGSEKHTFVLYRKGNWYLSSILGYSCCLCYMLIDANMLFSWLTLFCFLPILSNFLNQCRRRTLFSIKIGFKSSHQRCSIIKSVFRNFTKLKGKHPVPESFLILFLIKKETLAQVFSCEFCEISQNTFYRTPPNDCFWGFYIQQKICKINCSLYLLLTVNILI